MWMKNFVPRPTANYLAAKDLLSKISLRDRFYTLKIKVDCFSESQPYPISEIKNKKGKNKVGIKAQQRAIFCPQVWPITNCYLNVF